MGEGDVGPCSARSSRTLIKHKLASIETDLVPNFVVFEALLVRFRGKGVESGFE